MIDVDNLLTADDLAVIFKVKRRRVMEWQAKHGWPHVRVGRTIRWTPEHVEQIKARHTVTANGEIKSTDKRTARSAARRAS